MASGLTVLFDSYIDGSHNANFMLHLLHYCHLPVITWSNVHPHVFFLLTVGGLSF